MMMVNDSLDTIMSKLEKILNTKTVVGEPVQIGGVTLIPVVDVTFGFGAGGGEGGTKENTGTGGGGGGGARVAAKAVIVIKGDDISVLPFARGGAIEKIMEMVPGLVEKLAATKPEKEKTEN